MSKIVKDNAVIILIVVVVLITLAIGSGIEGGATLSGGSGLAVIVNYEDGTSETFLDPERRSITARWIPLEILIMNDKPVISVDFIMKYKANWDGDLVSYEFRGDVIALSDGVMKKTEHITTPSTIVRGSYTTIASFTVLRETLESWAGTAGEHQLQAAGVLTLTITFADGTSDTVTKSDVVNIGYIYNPEAGVGLSGITFFEITTRFGVQWP